MWSKSTKYIKKSKIVQKYLHKVKKIILGEGGGEKEIFLKFYEGLNFGPARKSGKFFEIVESETIFGKLAQ
jgi:hypothetical protein